MMDAKPYARSPRLRASSRVFVTAFARLRHRGRAFASRVFVSRALDRRARARRGVRAGRARAGVAARPTTRSDNTDHPSARWCWRARDRDGAPDARARRRRDRGMDAPHAPRERRPRRDLAWSAAFLTTIGLALALGIAATATTTTTRDARDARARWTDVRDGGACLGGDESAWRETLATNAARIETTTGRAASALGLGAAKGLGRRSSVFLGRLGANESAVEGDDDGETLADGAAVMRRFAPWAASAFAASFALGAGLMYALKNHARRVVWGVMIAEVGLMAAYTLYAMMTLDGNWVLLLVFTLLSALVAYTWRDELNLVASMISVSTISLSDNPHLVTVTIGLQCLVMAFVAPMAWFAVQASQHGSAIINQYATEFSNDACTGYYGQSVDCCKWNIDSWVGPYYALVVIACVWFTSCALEARMYVIGGVVSQWYFAPAGTKSFKGTTRTSVSNAYGPSFGTIAYGGFVITVVEIIRSMANKSRRERNNYGNPLCCLFYAMLDCIFAVIEYLSRFAMIQASITGEAFCDAARSINDLLKRNFLLAYGAYAFPKHILGFLVFVLAALLGYCVNILSKHVFAANSLGAIVNGIGSFFIAYIVLSFFVMILLNCVDAVFVCYALDKDRAAVHHPDLHKVFDEVTRKQRAIEESDAEGMEEPLISGKPKYASM